MRREREGGKKGEGRRGERKEGEERRKEEGRKKRKREKGGGRAEGGGRWGHGLRKRIKGKGATKRSRYGGKRGKQGIDNVRKREE